MPEHTCTKCGETKPATTEHFARATHGRKDGLSYWCKPCNREVDRAYRAANPQRRRDRKAKARAKRRAAFAAKEAPTPRDAAEVLAQRLEHHLKNRYGISANRYVEMYDEQGGRCAICTEEAVSEPFHVDHDHATGSVRGLLCRRCNVGLGMFGDDPERLAAAIRYLV